MRARSCAEMPVVDAVRRVDRHGERACRARRCCGRPSAAGRARAARSRVAGEADQAPAVLGEEVDASGVDLLGRHHEVALVLAVLVVDDDHHLAAAQRRERGLDANPASLPRPCRVTSVHPRARIAPIVSAPLLAARRAPGARGLPTRRRPWPARPARGSACRPRARRPNRVAASVCGIRVTVKRLLERPLVQGEADAVDGDRALRQQAPRERAGSATVIARRIRPGASNRSSRPVPSTWPSTKWPSSWSPTRSAGSR